MAHGAFGDVDRGIGEPTVVGRKRRIGTTLVVSDHSVGCKRSDINRARVLKHIRAETAALESQLTITANRAFILNGRGKYSIAAVEQFAARSNRNAGAVHKLR